MSLVVLARGRGEADPCSLSPLRLRERAEWLSKERRELPGEENGELKMVHLSRRACCSVDKSRAPRTGGGYNSLK